MSDEQSPNPSTAGQADTAPWSQQGQAEITPASRDGQAEAPESQDQGQARSTPATDEPSFFDPSNLPPELLATYKQMQGAFTTKTQEIARQRQKIEAYDNFMRDPIVSIQQLAAQYGLNLTRAQAQQVQQESQADWQPNTWDELLTKAEERAEQRIMQRIAPYFGQVQKMQASSVEQQLSTIDPNWRDYENNMRELLSQHPSLVNDIGKLYRLAVPQETLEAKAIQAALKKFEGKAQHSNVSAGGTAPRGKPSTPQVKTFEDAVRAAKSQLNTGE